MRWDDLLRLRARTPAEGSLICPEDILLNISILLRSTKNSSVNIRKNDLSD